MSDFFPLQLSCYFLTMWNEMVGSHPVTVSRSVTVGEQTDPRQKCMLETVRLAKPLSASPRPLHVSPGLLDDKLNRFFASYPPFSPFLDSQRQGILPTCAIQGPPRNCHTRCLEARSTA